MGTSSRAAKQTSDEAVFGEDDTIELVSIFGVLRRRKWLIIAVAALGTTIAAAVGVQLTPSYTAKSQVMIEPQENKIINVEAVMAGLTPDASVLTTQVGILQSRTFLARVMSDLKLFDDPEFNGALNADQAPSGPIAKLLEPVQQILGFIPQEWLIATGLAKEQPVQLESDAPRIGRESAITTFAKSLTIQNETGSYLISVDANSESPQKASKIANRVVEMYVADQLNAKLSATDQASGWLEERLGSLRQEVRKNDEAVAQYKAKNGLFDAQGESINDQQLSSINTQLITARADLAEQQAKLRLVSELRAHGKGLDAVQEVGASPLILNLREQETQLVRQEAQLRNLYGEKHPRMIDLRNEKADLEHKVNAEINRIVQTMDNDVKVAQTRVSSIENQLGSYKNRNVQDREAQIKLDELVRNADSSHQLYDAFLQRYKETKEQQQIVQPDARVIAVAAPPSLPSSPGPKLFTAAGFLVSVTLGSGLALLLERLDRGIRSAREVEALLGLPTLGMVPLLDRLKRSQKPHQYLREKPLSAYAEAVRSVYTGLKLGGGPSQPKVVLVTSSLPEEGKTTLTVSLATLVARSNKRVLLVDLDLRHPSVHRELGWQVSAGVVEYMAGERSLEEVIHHDLETGLHFLPVKLQTTTPLELIESDKMRELIETCRETYDVVFIDTAPVASVTDTRVAAALADKLVFVVHWGKTIEAAARDSLQSLREAGVEPAGVVLTQIDMRKHAQYGYTDIGQYYTRSQRYYVN